MTEVTYDLAAPEECAQAKGIFPPEGGLSIVRTVELPRNQEAARGGASIRFVYRESADVRSWHEGPHPDAENLADREPQPVLQVTLQLAQEAGLALNRS